MNFAEITAALANKFGRKPMYYQSPRKIALDDVKPIPGTYTVYFIGRVLGETGEYVVNVGFYRVEFVKEPGKGILEYPDPKTGAHLLFKIPSIKSNPVGLRCGCQDFRFRFEYPLSLIKSLIGPVRKYTRKTTTRPPVNPDNVPGYCKHLYWFVRKLMSDGLVRD